MAGRTDKTDGVASADDRPLAEPGTATSHPSREDARSDDVEKADGEEADPEIAAGDLADDLADFA